MSCFCRLRKRAEHTADAAILTWVAAVTVATAAVWFVHECAHGVGYTIDGAAVSTGFNMVGGHGKAPGDLGFRAGVPVTGTPNLGTFFGPLTNWLVSAAATVAFWRRPRGKRGLVLAAAAVGAALQRVLSLASFFVAAAFGRVIYQDELEWGARHVRVLSFPTNLQAFEIELRDHRHQVLATPAVYVWPTISLAICVATLVVVYRLMRKHQAASLGRRWRLAVAAPFVAWAVVGIVFVGLDQVIRINW